MQAVVGRRAIRVLGGHLGIVVVRMGIGMSFHPSRLDVAPIPCLKGVKGLILGISGSTALYCSDPKCQPEFGTCGGGT